MDISASRSFGRRADGGARMEVRVAADNIFDSAIYDQCGLPQPGRTLRLQLSVR
jgi:iron complex outermembrane receptor protein